jgi:carbon storage regulator
MCASGRAFRLFPAFGRQRLDGAVLVLRRRPGEAIVIGADIEIEVIEISRTRVKLGVIAPRDVLVLRKETIAVAAENRRALEFIAGGTENVTETLRLLGTALITRQG